MPPYLTVTEAVAAAPADRPFVTYWLNEDEHETVTFGDFRERTAAYATAMLDRGVTAGDRVVVIMPQGIPAVAAFAGAMQIGAIPAFLAYPNFKVDAAKYRAGLEGVTANLNAKLVIIDNEFPDELLEHISLANRAQLLRGASQRVQASPFVSHESASDDVAFIQHSAGTTGLQKGVALTHKAVLRQLDQITSALRVNPDDCIYSWLPLYHDMGLIACFILPMVYHLHVVMQSPLDWVMHPETMLEVMSEYRCTLGWLPNFAFQFVPRRSRGLDRAACDLSSVRALINCSEPVRASSMKEFNRAFTRFGLSNKVLHSSYAMAENTFAVTQSDLDSGPRELWADGACFRSEHLIISVDENTPGAIPFVSSGLVLPGNEARIVSESGETLGDGNVGEIFIRSGSLFTGYYNRPDLTAAAIVDGWYRTGDLGFFLDGELFVVGRKKDLLIVGGENLYPQDIEEIISEHPAIHDGRAVAMGIYNRETGTEDIIVVAEVEQEESLANGELLERELRSRITAGLGVAVRTIILKPPKWIVKSTAGKPARSATRSKLLQEHPEFVNEEN